MSVSDTGIGMDSATRQRAFEPFFTTKEVGQGTGLGLSTVFGIMKQSRGHIEVYSEPNKGTSFKLYFPRLDQDTAAATEVETWQRPAAREDVADTVLVVEDESTLRKILSDYLKSANYRVLEASCSEEALELAHAHPEEITLLVTDVVLPGKSGRQLAEAARDIIPKAEVLYISGYTPNAIVHHGVLDPGLHFLQKPFTRTALLKKVCELLEPESASAWAEPSPQSQNIDVQ
jgi:two-component system cell cycle sensor histidine kinase/response regulator CckA